MAAEQSVDRGAANDAIETITPAACRALAAEITAALKTIAERHGLTVMVGGGSYDASMFRPRVEFKVADSARIEWNRYAGVYELPQDAIGKLVVINHTEYAVRGLKPSARRMPVVVERVRDGKMFKMAAEPVAKALGGF